jgi:hypothetical protein
MTDPAPPDPDRQDWVRSGQVSNLLCQVHRKAFCLQTSTPIVKGPKAGHFLERESFLISSKSRLLRSVVIIHRLIVHSQ